jgi:hypothetical protein
MYVKYVMTKDGLFVIANKMTGYAHNEIALLGLGILDAADKSHGLSGGFLYCEEDGSYSSYGRSESLGVDSRPEDGQLISDALRDGKVRFEDLEEWGRDGYIAGNHPSMMDEQHEVATRDKMREYRITE